MNVSELGIWDECGACQHANYAKIRRVLPSIAVVEFKDKSDDEYYGLVLLDGGDELERGPFHIFEITPEYFSEEKFMLAVKMTDTVESLEGKADITSHEKAILDKYNAIDEEYIEWQDKVEPELNALSKSFTLDYSIQIYREALDVDSYVENEMFVDWLYKRTCKAVQLMKNDPVRSRFEPSLKVDSKDLLTIEEVSALNREA